MEKGLDCTWMRGGTSKGAFFLRDDLPADVAERDRLLLSIMGTPDPRQIDGIGGADPLTSKVAIIAKSKREGVDIDFLFLQVFVDRPLVSDAQNCGNILAGVGPFAVEKRLFQPTGDRSELRVYLENSNQVVKLTIETPGGQISYRGDARIDGVPGTSAPVLQDFPDAAGSSCGALLPTGNLVDQIDGVAVTMIDNGMPVVVMKAEDVGISGYEDRENLEANTELKARLEAIRLQAGPLMNLGDVTNKTVPKMTMVAPPRHGGALTTRTFIPHRCHASIGVLGAVSVATAALLEGSPANLVAELPEGDQKPILVEHPLGELTVVMQLDVESGLVTIHKAAVLRTARKLFQGKVFPK